MHIFCHVWFFLIICMTNKATSCFIKCQYELWNWKTYKLPISLCTHTFLYIFFTLSVFTLRNCCAKMTPKEKSKEHFKMETIFLIPIFKVTFLSLGCNIARLAWKQAHSIWLTQTPLFHRPIFLYPTECTQSWLNIFTADKYFERGYTN